MKNYSFEKQILYSLGEKRLSIVNVAVLINGRSAEALYEGVIEYRNKILVVNCIFAATIGVLGAMYDYLLLGVGIGLIVGLAPLILPLPVPINYTPEEAIITRQWCVLRKRLKMHPSFKMLCQTLRGRSDVDFEKCLLYIQCREYMWDMHSVAVGRPVTLL